MTSSGPVAVACGLLALASLSSCSDGGSSEITVKRELSKYERDRPVAVDTTAEERYRFAAMKLNQTQQAEPSSSAPAPGGSAGGAPELKWDTPEGWSEAPPKTMRDVNLTFGPDNEGECYVSRLPGAAGGLESNLNRWRKQMGQGELSPEEIAALPTGDIMGGKATYMSVDGTFTGMGNVATIEDARMLGMVLMTEGGALFAKMTGPKELVAANTAKFEDFCASLRLE